MLSVLSYGQNDTLKTYDVEVLGMSSYDFENITSLIKSSTIFGFTYYCVKENIFVVESDMDLSKEELYLLFSPAIEEERLKLLDCVCICDMNTSNKIIKR